MITFEEFIKAAIEGKLSVIQAYITENSAIPEEIERSIFGVGLRNGDTALTIAARFGHVDIVDLLLTVSTVKVNPGYYGLSPLIFAIERFAFVERHDEFLGRIAKVKKLNVSDLTADKLYKIYSNADDFAELAYQHPSEAYLAYTRQPALYHNYTKIRDSLLRHKNINVNAEIYDGLTPLIVAVICSGKNIHLGEDPLHDVRALLAVKSIQVDARDKKNKTALMHAAACANIGAVKLLLKAGADPSLTDNDHKTAAMLTANDEIRYVLEYAEAMKNISTGLDWLSVASRKMKNFSPLSEALKQVALTFATNEELSEITPQLFDIAAAMGSVEAQHIVSTFIFEKDKSEEKKDVARTETVALEAESLKLMLFAHDESSASSTTQIAATPGSGGPT